MSKAKQYLTALASLSVINNAVPKVVANLKEPVDPYYASSSYLQTSTTPEFGFSKEVSEVREDVGVARIGVELTLCGSSGDSIASVDYSTSDGTATIGQDYVATSGTLTWGSSGDCGTRHIEVAIIDDGVAETTEAINITLSNAVGGSLGSSGAAVLNILDNDASDFGFSTRTAISLEEQDFLSVIVERRSCTNLSGPAWVDLHTSDGSAENTLDYQSVDGTLSWGSSGDCGLKTFFIPILNDSIAEPTETILVSLSNARGDTNGSSGGVNASLAYIVDDESPVNAVTSVPGPSPFASQDVITACDLIVTTGEIAIETGIDGTFLAPTVSIDYKVTVEAGAVLRIPSEEMNIFCP